MKKEELKSHSIIALNLQTVEDVEQVIRQCEALKGQMQGGSENKIHLADDRDDFAPFTAKRH